MLHLLQTSKVIHSVADCAEPFKAYRNKHMFKGQLAPFPSLSQCQTNCLESPDCLGIDWDKDSITPDDQRCFFILSKSIRYGKEPRDDNCCDHYRKKTECSNTQFSQSKPRLSQFSRSSLLSSASTEDISAFNQPPRIKLSSADPSAFNLPPSKKSFSDDISNFIQPSLIKPSSPSSPSSTFSSIPTERISIKSEDNDNGRHSLTNEKESSTSLALEKAFSANDNGVAEKPERKPSGENNKASIVDTPISSRRKELSASESQGFYFYRILANNYINVVILATNLVNIFI